MIELGRFKVGDKAKVLAKVPSRLWLDGIMDMTIGWVFNVVEVIGEKIRLDNNLFYPINSLGVVVDTTVKEDSDEQDFCNWEDDKVLDYIEAHGGKFCGHARESYLQDFDDWKDEEWEVEPCDMCAGCTKDCEHYNDSEFPRFVKINDEADALSLGKEKTNAAPYPECIQEEPKNVEIKEACSVKFKQGTLFIIRNKDNVCFEYSSYDTIDDIHLNKKDVEAIISFLAKVYK